MKEFFKAAGDQANGHKVCFRFVRLVNGEMNQKFIRLIAVIYTVILFLLNFIRIFDNDLWGDEAFTANLVKNNLLGIVTKTAEDVHPPLYYFIVKLFYEIFGKQGWMFHMVSLLPLAIILIFALTVIWDRFGKATSLIFITIAGLSGNAVLFNVQIRMYSWGALFVLLSYYYLYRILSDNRTRSYVLFVMFSLAAAYTHYYCLVSVAFFYVLLVLLCFFKKCIDIKKVLLSCTVTVACYLPWLLVMVNSMLDRTDEYWIKKIPSIEDSVRYLFSNQFSTLMIFLCGIALILAVAYETGTISLKKIARWEYNIIGFKNFHITKLVIWLAGGVLSVFGTICVGIGISKLIRPFYVLRYIYPVSVIAWLILGVAVSKLKGKKAYTALLIVYMLIIFIPAYQTVYLKDKAKDESLKNTLEATREIDDDDIILANFKHMYWSIAEYYYPGTESQKLIVSDIPKLDKSKTYWLILKKSKKQTKIFEQLDEQGFTYEQIVDNGILGTWKVSIYKMTYE